jgi:protein arginine N-methyltransferase 1
MLEFHRKMLADRVRNEAFHEALKRVIKPGETVVADIGAGTGFLSFLAKKLGAKECHLYEMAGSLRAAKVLAKANKTEGLKFVHRHSTEVKNPPKADVVVSETLGNFALEEHILETLNDARVRFLKPGGVIIPGKLKEFASPVVTDRFHHEIDTWKDVGFDLDLSLLRSMTFCNAYVRTFGADDLLKGTGAVQSFDEIDFSVENDSCRTCSAQWKLEAAQAVYGCAVWWEAELVPGVTLSTSPFAPATHWEQIYLPIPEPLEAQAGDALLLSLISDSRLRPGLNVSWRLSLFREGKKVSSSPLLDMRSGQLD